MGTDASKSLTPEALNDLKKQTTFSGREIREWYKKFHTDCPSGQMDKAEFKAMYEQLFPKGNSTQFADHVFRAYDTDGNGAIDFQEFLCTINITSRGSIDDKLRWAFHMYDLDGNGYITKKEVTEIFKAVYKMRGKLSATDCQVTPDKAAEQMFEHLDKNGDEKLSDLEFIIGAKSSPEVLGILQTDTME